MANCQASSFSLLSDSFAFILFVDLLILISKITTIRYYCQLFLFFLAYSGIKLTATPPEGARYSSRSSSAVTFLDSMR